MNNMEFKKVDWINIIVLKNFKDYFDMKELQGLSMLSKFTRSKLKPILFKSIRLFYYTNRETDDIPFKTFNVKSFKMLSNKAVRDEHEIETSLYIKNCVSDVNSEVQDIKHSVNGAFISKLEWSGLYLYPILSNFINLSVLKIHRSIIQYSIFQKLGEYFPMLETFELYRVILLKKSTSNDDLNETTFPVNLNYLSIWRIEIANKSMPNERCMAQFYDYDFNFRSKFSLPNIYLPSLKKLQFLRCSVENSGLKEFLETNPSLEELSIDRFSPNITEYFNSLKSLYIDQLEKISNLENLTNQNIKTLKINITNNGYYDKFEKICLMCPSVELLRIKFDCTEPYQEVINHYLIPILKKLPNLKIIELPFDGIYNESIDVNHFSKVEKIVFEMENVLYPDIYFEKSRNLKEVEFRSTYIDIDKEVFLICYKRYSDWKFEVFRRKVKGYKVSNKSY